VRWSLLYVICPVSCAVGSATPAGCVTMCVPVWRSDRHSKAVETENWICCLRLSWGTKASKYNAVCCRLCSLISLKLIILFIQRFSQIGKLYLTMKEHIGDKSKNQSRYTKFWRLRERRRSSYSFLTSPPGVVVCSVSRLGRALPPGKGPSVPIDQQARWNPERVWTQRLEKKHPSLCPGRYRDRRSSVRS
jgi:hypothetical protein